MSHGGASVTIGAQAVVRGVALQTGEGKLCGNSVMNTTIRKFQARQVDLSPAVQRGDFKDNRGECGTRSSMLCMMNTHFLNLEHNRDSLIIIDHNFALRDATSSV